MKKLFLCAAAAMLALVGCEKQVQSSISLEDVDMVAHVKGTLVFDAAQAGIDTKVDTLANQRVYFIVNANLYDGNANPTDKRSFEATTDAHGQFDITVPAGAKQISGELRTDVIKLALENGQTIYLKETVKAFDLYAGDNKFDKIICYVDELLSACQGRASVNGRVVYDPGIISKNGHKEKGVLAADGANVCLLARYDKAGLSEKLGTDSVKLFTIKTDKDGFFTMELPVSNDNTKAVDVDVTVANFDAKFIDEINGNEVPRDAKFAKTAPITVSLKDGNFMKVAEAGKDVIELDRVWIAPITTATTTFKVKGELKLDAEEQTFGTGDYVNMITGVKHGSTEYTNKINGGAFQLEIKHVVSGEVLSTIILDCNAKADGTFAEDVTVYDDWKSGDIQIFLNIKKFVVSDYVHFYKGAIYKNNKWQSFPVDWCDYDSSKKKIKTGGDYTETQDCPGFYEHDGSKTAYAWDGTFDVNVGTVQAKFTMDPTFAKNELLGVGNIVGGKNIDEDEDGNQIAGNGLSY
jgi:hypothetical protein